MQAWQAAAKDLLAGKHKLASSRVRRPAALPGFQDGHCGRSGTWSHLQATVSQDGVPGQQGERACVQSWQTRYIDGKQRRRKCNVWEGLSWC